jgi:hypothetical protein
MVLYACMCCVYAFSLGRESPDMILGDKPLILEVVLSQLVTEQDWCKTHTKASKNRIYIIGEESLAHISTTTIRHCIHAAPFYSSNGPNLIHRYIGHVS